MGRTANIIIKDVIHIFASISKIMRILLMGRRNRERCIWCISMSRIIPQGVRYDVPVIIGLSNGLLPILHQTFHEILDQSPQLTSLLIS